MKLFHQSYLSDRSEKKIIVFVVFLSFLIRVLWVLIFDPEIVSDARWYFEKGGMIASGEGYYSDGHKTAFYPIGYPAFLSILFYVFGQSVIVGRIANVLLSGLSIWIFYLLSKQFTKSSLLRLISVFLFAFYPNYISYSALLYNETFFTMLFLSGLYLQITAINQNNIKRLLFSALIYGLAVLTRPATICIPILVFFISFIGRYQFVLEIRKKNLIKHIILHYVLILLVLLPWQIRNYKTFDSFVFVSTTGGFDLLIGNNPEANGNYNPDADYFSKIDRSGSEVDYDRRVKKMAKNYIKANPYEVLKRLPRKAYFFLWPGMDGVSWNMQEVSHAKKIFLDRLRYFGNGYYVLLLALLLVVIFFNLFHWRKTTLLFWIAIVIFAYYLLVSLVFFGESRFHFHLVPLVLLLLAERTEAMINKSAIN